MDLTRAREQVRLQPVRLVEITLNNSGPTLYFAERNIVVGGQRYEDYVEEVAGLGEERRRTDSSGRNNAASIKLKNDPFMCGYGAGIARNGGFETGDFAGWSGNAMVPNSSTIDSADKHGGTYSAKVVADGTDGSLGVKSDPWQVPDATKRHRVAAWNKVANFNPTYPRTYVIELLFYSDAAGTALITSVSVLEVTGDQAWAEVSQTVGPAVSGADITLPPNTKSVCLQQRFSGSGGVPNTEGWIDDVRFELLEVDHLIQIGGSYAFEGAAVAIKECYLGLDGTPSDVETVFAGALDEPRDIDLATFIIKASSREYVKNMTWRQEYITSEEFPNASEDLGEVIPIIYGDDVLVPSLRVDWGARTTLVASLDASQTSGIELSDSSRFPSSGTVIIDGEEISYTSITSSVLGGVTRGAGSTTATIHRKGAVVWQKKTQYDSLLADRALKAVGDIYAEVGGNLLRVISGVSAVVSGGRQLLRATGQVKMDAAIEDIDFTAPAGGSSKFIIPNAAGDDVLDNFSNMGNVIDANDSTWAQGDPGGAPPTTRYISVKFPSTDYGAISRQWAWITYSCTTAANASVGRSHYNADWGTLPGTATTKRRVRLELSGSGNWGDGIFIRVLVAAGEQFSMFEVEKEVEYQTTLTKSGGLVSTRDVVRFHAVVDGISDPDGNYGGAGALIERPDYVIKHFLVQVAGEALADVDATSFNAAGTLLAAAGYKFAFRLGWEEQFSAFAERLARECRCTLAWRSGKWRLDWIPDAAPAADAVIEAGDIAGEFGKFSFRKTSVRGVKNDLTARFKRCYTRVGGASEWDGTTGTASDSLSKSMYGFRPENFDFELIRLQSVAEDLLGHMIKQRSMTFVEVEFPVRWEYFDLGPGDTVEIDTQFFGVQKFYVEEVARGKDMIKVVARQWW